MERPKKMPKAKRTERKVVIPCRLSFVHLEKPHAAAEGSEPKYEVSCLIPKDDTETVEAVKAAIALALDEGKAKFWHGKVPAGMRDFLKDGDEYRPDDENYQGHYFFGARSAKAVPVLNRLQERIEPSEAYSGCYAMVSATVFAFNTTASKGISAGLNAVLKFADGDPLGGVGNAEKDFDGIDMGVDEDLNDL